jgi:uncharacterized protein
MRIALRLILLGFAACLAISQTFAQEETADGMIAPDGTPPIKALPGTLSWAVLQGVDTAKQDGKVMPKFGQEVNALHEKEIKIRGFMVPTEGAIKQQRFLLSPYPPSCPFCLTAGPDSLIDVQTKEGIKTTFEPLVISGKLHVLAEDAQGFYFRITEATQAE